MRFKDRIKLARKIRVTRSARYLLSFYSQKDKDCVFCGGDLDCCTLKSKKLLVFKTKFYICGHCCEHMKEIGNK